jgi:hypothetical protein
MQFRNHLAINIEPLVISIQLGVPLNCTWLLVSNTAFKEKEKREMWTLTFHGQLLISVQRHPFASFLRHLDHTSKDAPLRCRSTATSANPGFSSVIFRVQLVPMRTLRERRSNSRASKGTFSSINDNGLYQSHSRIQTRPERKSWCHMCRWWAGSERRFR